MEDAKSKEVVEMLIQHEQAVAALYSAYHDLLLPGMDTFWERLKNEELAHADVLRMLMKASEDTALNERHFNSTAIQTTILIGICFYTPHSHCCN